MKLRCYALIALLMIICVTTDAQDKGQKIKPWEHGRLRVSDNQRFLQHEDGTPFFWLGETAWLMPQRLNRDEVQYYLQICHEAEYNMVQVQVMNEVPVRNERAGTFFASDSVRAVRAVKFESDLSVSGPAGRHTRIGSCRAVLRVLKRI